MQTSARMQRIEWLVLPADDRADQLAKTLKVSSLVAQVLLNRGLSEPSAGHAFLQPKLTELIGPDRMPGVTEAVGCLKRAIEDNEKITIYGDYDVDGITGVAILWQLLTLLGATVDYYIPHRIDEGYGLNAEAMRGIAESGSNVVVTVDCGITAVKTAELAVQLGLSLIVTDHHRPGESMPQAAAIVHPALGDSYANPDSAGAMVALKLAWALANEFSSGAKLEPMLRQFMLDATSLAAMGTVADVADLRGENRVLTSYGLRALAQCGLPGIQALIETAGLTGKGLDSYDIGFKLAPMLNAAGRMGHARLAVELLTSNSQLRCVHIAEYLKEQNAQRQQCERKIIKQACEMITQRHLHHPDRRSIVLAKEDWHAGVLGIVASRIVDRFYRPTIMINSTPGEGGAAQGSGRSIEGFCLLSAIKACSEHLTSFGGHTRAAGLTIEPSRIDDFAEAFEAYARKNLSSEDVVCRLTVDALASLGQFSLDVVTQLKMLGPFGQGNPRPIFATRGVRLIAPPRRVGLKGDHLQLSISDGTGAVRCVGFRMGKLEKKLLETEFFNVAYEVQINTYNGRNNVEFILADIQFE